MGDEDKDSTSEQAQPTSRTSCCSLFLELFYTISFCWKFQCLYSVYFHFIFACLFNFHGDSVAKKLAEFMRRATIHSWLTLGLCLYTLLQILRG
jgi:hypothetical protein